VLTEILLLLLLLLCLGMLLQSALLLSIVRKLRLLHCGLSHEWWALGKERIITCEESIECRRVVVVLPPNSSVKRC